MLELIAYVIMTNLRQIGSNATKIGPDIRPNYTIRTPYTQTYQFG